MTTYKEIKGTQIEVVSSDPSNPVEGQVWYNSTDQAVKGLATTAAGAWATGGTTNQVRSQAAGSGADKDAALVFAGYTGTAGAGADGVVIFRTLTTASATTGSPTVTTDGSYNIYKFTGSGSITF